MKLVLRTFFFHTLCIFIFSFIYLNFAEHLSHKNSSNNINYIDYLLLSTTIQCGVGLTEFVPNNDITKLILILQQYIMMLTHLITLYFFTV